MPASVEVLVWLERREYDALKQALQASGIDSVEREAERLLRQRYEQLVPKEQREQIDEQLQKEIEQEAREREAARRYSAVRITEGGLSRCFETDNMDMLSHAYTLRRHLRGEHGASTLAQEYAQKRNTEIDNRYPSPLPEARNRGNRESPTGSSAAFAALLPIFFVRPYFLLQPVPGAD